MLKADIEITAELQEVKAEFEHLFSGIKVIPNRLGIPYMNFAAPHVGLVRIFVMSPEKYNVISQNFNKPDEPEEFMLILDMLNGWLGTKFVQCYLCVGGHYAKLRGPELDEAMDPKRKLKIVFARDFNTAAIYGAKLLEKANKYGLYGKAVSP